MRGSLRGHRRDDEFCNDVDACMGTIITSVDENRGAISANSQEAQRLENRLNETVVLFSQELASRDAIIESLKKMLSHVLSIALLNQGNLEKVNATSSGFDQSIKFLSAGMGEMQGAALDGVAARAELNATVSDMGSLIQSTQQRQIASVGLSLTITAAVVYMAYNFIQTEKYQRHVSESVKAVALWVGRARESLVHISGISFVALHLLQRDRDCLSFKQLGPNRNGKQVWKSDDEQMSAAEQHLENVRIVVPEALRLPGFSIPPKEKSPSFCECISSFFRSSCSNSSDEENDRARYSRV